MDIESYSLEKSIWTEADVETMGWHDATVYAMSFENGSEEYCGDFVLDIDYIFKWVHPTPPERHFTFWVSPCTLVFKNALQIKMHIDTGMFALEGLQIADISSQESPNQISGKRYIYSINLQEGQIQLHADGFTQIVRRLPMYGHQALEMQQRGGISFSRIPADNNG